MPEKRSFPLNNPLQEKTNITTDVDDVNGGRDRGVSKGGKERVKPCEATLKCPHCGRELKVVFAFGRPPEWVRCVWCGELQPADGYRVIAYGLGLPQPLAPHELKAQQRQFER